MILAYWHPAMSPPVPALSAAAPLARLCKALGDATRLRIVALLAHGELCVCHLEKALGLRQSTTSRQLSVLRAAGVVEARRDASWVRYRLAPQPDALCKRFLGELARSFAADEALRREVTRLVRAAGPTCK